VVDRIMKRNVLDIMAFDERICFLGIITKSWVSVFGISTCTGWTVRGSNPVRGNIFRSLFSTTQASIDKSLFWELSSFGLLRSEYCFTST
jgi:hypothetical protein